MSCKPVCKLCPRTKISQSVTYASGVLTIDLPAGEYQDGGCYGIVVAQTIPATTVIGAPVMISINGGAVRYPLLKCNGAQATVYNVDTRTRYMVRVSTSVTGGSFRMLGRSCCPHDGAPASLNGEGTPVPATRGEVSK